MYFNERFQRFDLFPFAEHVMHIGERLLEVNLITNR